VLTRDPEVGAAVANHVSVICDELNVKEVITTADESGLVSLSAKANFRTLGPVLGPRMPEVAAKVAALGHDDIERLLDGGTSTLAGHQLSRTDVLIERTPREGTVVETGTDFAVALDTRVSETLFLEGLAREIVSRVQRMRRDAGLEVTDRIALQWWSEDPDLRAAIAAHVELIGAELLASTITEASEPLATIDLDERVLGLAISPVGAG
jgi:isoleucyl-tRNA synthetase